MRRQARIKLLNMMTVHDMLDNCIEALQQAKDRVPELRTAIAEIENAQQLIRDFSNRLREEERSIV